jgi:hypothetical protein
MCLRAAEAALSVNKLGLVNYFVERGIGLDKDDVQSHVLGLRSKLQMLLNDRSRIYQLGDNTEYVDMKQHSARVISLVDEMQAVDVVSSFMSAPASDR